MTVPGGYKTDFQERTIDTLTSRLIQSEVLSRFVLELGDAISGISRVPSQAARSIG
jgi:hypothetical protein